MNQELWVKYPECKLGIITNRIGDNIDGVYNTTEEYDWDDEDCDEMNEVLWAKYPDCKYGIDPGKIGNTLCDGGMYNTEECGWDDGDYTFFNTEFPNCNVVHPYKLGNGVCDPDANTEECGYDGGDCI
ncbi:hypothetical protein CTEN210_18407 [Chaetoceros tenuissimus]|uniref:LNR domain-containing protein n=1 Tax=Chaetoceros tenuissimus TaxID=426638 RepID=A0AAD3DCS5_9STRA|nr:hypothetical protein CTEN210_18407 [Chaetoceros tenuissimus]